MRQDAKIYVAGHRGMVGSAIIRCLQEEGYSQLLMRSSASLDLRNQADVFRFFEEEKPTHVFLAAAKVGGIMANATYPADFLYDNLMIEANIIHAAYQNGVEKLLFLGSSCIYPKFADQPIKEDSLLTGTLEPTNEAYAIAKIAGIKLCQMYHQQYQSNFISAMPTNLYGYGDNYHLENSHVLPALIRKFHEAKVSGAAEVIVWGSGTPLREFMFSDDLGRACVYLMRHYDAPEVINVGSGQEVSIRQLAEMIQRIVGFEGAIVFDQSKPDGTPRKLMDSSRFHQLGFGSLTPLEEGIRLAYDDFVMHYVA